MLFTFIYFFFRFTLRRLDSNCFWVHWCFIWSDKECNLNSTFETILYFYFCWTDSSFNLVETLIICFCHWFYCHWTKLHIFILLLELLAKIWNNKTIVQNKSTQSFIRRYLNLLRFVIHWKNNLSFSHSKWIEWLWVVIQFCVHSMNKILYSLIGKLSKKSNDSCGRFSIDV